MKEFAITLLTAESKDSVLAAIQQLDPCAILDDEYPINEKTPTIWVTTSIGYDELDKIPNVKNLSMVYKGEGKPCTCGSGLPRWKLEDARGIFCSYICESCEKEVKSRYRIDVLENPNYEAVEQIEEDE